MKTSLTVTCYSYKPFFFFFFKHSRHEFLNAELCTSTLHIEYKYPGKVSLLLKLPVDILQHPGVKTTAAKNTNHAWELEQLLGMIPVFKYGRGGW